MYAVAYVYMDVLHVLKNVIGKISYTVLKGRLKEYSKETV